MRRSRVARADDEQRQRTSWTKTKAMPVQAPELARSCVYVLAKSRRGRGLSGLISCCVTSSTSRRATFACTWVLRDPAQIALTKTSKVATLLMRLIQPGRSSVERSTQFALFPSQYEILPRKPFRLCLRLAMAPDLPGNSQQRA